MIYVGKHGQLALAYDSKRVGFGNDIRRPFQTVNLGHNRYDGTPAVAAEAQIEI